MRSTYQLLSVWREAMGHGVDLLVWSQSVTIQLAAGALEDDVLVASLVLCYRKQKGSKGAILSL